MAGAELSRRSALPASRGAGEWVRRWWEGGAGWEGAFASALALPLEWIYRTGVGLRNRAYDLGALRAERAQIPVLSVGNLTVGGTGKTPVSAWLVRELRARGEKPALLTRGYGRDEVALHRRWNPGVPVIAGGDRVYGAWKAARAGATVVVLDDGFQHRRLARDLDLVLLAPFLPARVRLLPRGPFREPLSALRRAGLVLLTEKGREGGGGRVVPEGRLNAILPCPTARARLKAGRWTDLAGRDAGEPSGDLLAVAGTGDPGSFVRMLEEETGRPPELLSFPDHHPYGPRDVTLILRRARGRWVVVTEKDAVKLQAFAPELPRVRVLTLEVELASEQDTFWGCVLEALEKGRSSP